MIQKIAVYCGSSTGKQPEYTQAAARLGNWIADNQYGLVYGGASVGLMGTLANAVIEKKGFVTGVMPTHLKKREISSSQLSEFIEVEDMHERKKVMMEMSDAFVALPGGCGTMEEIFEVITWSQIGLHHKPFAFYNINGYYNHLRDFLFQMEVEGFTSLDHVNDILFTNSLEEIEHHFLTYQAPGEKTYS